MTGRARVVVAAARISVPQIHPRTARPPPTAGRSLSPRPTMQKILASVLASLLLFPASGLAQESEFSHDSAIRRGHDSTPPRTLRDSAIRQARLAAATETSQASQTAAPPNRPSLGSDVGKGALWGAAIGAGIGFAGALSCPAGCNGAAALLGVATFGAMCGSVIGLAVHVARRP